MKLRRAWLIVLLLGLACNAPLLSATAIPASDGNATPTLEAFNGPPPKVSIESPGANAQAVINQPFTVRVHATDGQGVTRVEMHESGRIVAVQPAANPNPDLTAILEYRPQALGDVSLEIVAYRGSVSSAPATVKVGIVASAAQLANPNSLDPTSGVAAGAICTARVNVTGLTLRNGPGVTFKSITTLSLGENLNVTGRNTDSTWYAVRRTTGNNANGWVSATYTKANGDCSSAPVVTPAP